MRNLNGISPPVVAATRPSAGRLGNQVVHAYEIRCITPIFGGGVAAKTTDPVTRIRPSSIRGHLRFWWRATLGRAYSTVSMLRGAESALWGDTEAASKVALSVKILNAGEDIQHNRSSIPGRGVQACYQRSFGDKIGI